MPVKTELVRHPLAQGTPPAWATAWGQDEYGIWAEFGVMDIKQNSEVVQRVRWVREGRFFMGSPKGETGRDNDENLHEVTLTRGFWLADTACTQELWQVVMGENPSRFKGENRPVETVSWDDCKLFFEELNRRVAGLDAGLPTEAQWEYACRAGTQTPYNFEETLSKERVNYESNETVAVKSLPPNGWGLYEMHGNVWEWCRDRWQEHITESATDPVGPDKGSHRVNRGGSLSNNARFVRSAFRFYNFTNYRYHNLGFRFSPGQERQGAGRLVHVAQANKQGRGATGGLREAPREQMVKNNDKAALQRSYGNQALLLKERGKLDEALELFKKQEVICSELGDKDGLQGCYGKQADILHILGEFAEAMVLLKKQEAICIETKNTSSIQISYGNQALILMNWGRVDEAMELSKKQELRCIELEDKNGLLVSYSNQTVIFQSWEKYDEAMELSKKAEAICIELGDKNGLQTNYGHQGMILKDLGKLDEAMALLKKQETICIELGQRLALQVCYVNQALVLMELRKWDVAMELLKKQEGICLEFGNKAGLLSSYGHQAIILKELGKLDDAMELLKKQERLCIELGNRYSLEPNYANQALILKKWGKYNEAMELAKKAEAIGKELKDNNRLQASYDNQALLRKDIGRT